MDDDMLKNWENDDNSMDMMGIMMQMEKFPELSEPFYTLTNADNGNFTATTTLTSANPNVTTSTATGTMINPPPLSSYNPMTRNASFSHPLTEKKCNMAAMREMIFRMAVMQPIHIDPESVKPPKRKNVKISKDPQSVAARHRRERISEKIRILQRLVPGGTKMDTASMLDEAIHYVKFLKKQVQILEQAGGTTRPGFNVNYSANLFVRGCQPCQMMGPSSKQMLT